MRHIYKKASKLIDKYERLTCDPTEDARKKQIIIAHELQVELYLCPDPISGDEYEVLQYIDNLFGTNQHQTGFFSDQYFKDQADRRSGKIRHA